MNQEMMYTQMYGSVPNPNQPTYGSPAMPQNEGMVAPAIDNQPVMTNENPLISQEENNMAPVEAPVQIVSAEENVSLPTPDVAPPMASPIPTTTSVPSQPTDKGALGFLNEYLDDINVKSLSYCNKKLIVNYVNSGKQEKAGDYVEGFTKLIDVVKHNGEATDKQFTLKLKNLNIEVINEEVTDDLVVYISKDYNWYKNKDQLLGENFATENCLTLVDNLIKTNFNLIIAGEKDTGKTNFIKYLVNIIPKEDKIIVLNKNYNLRSSFVDKTIIEFNQSFEDNLLVALSQNPDWFILNEFPKDIDILIKILTNGVKVIIEMPGNKENISTYIKYMVQDDKTLKLLNQYLNIGILLSKKQKGEAFNYFIEEISENVIDGVNKTIYKDEKIYKLSPMILKKMDNYGVNIKEYSQEKAMALNELTGSTKEDEEVEMLDI